MDNARIAKQLQQLADLLEFTGANPFRLRAYRNGARVIKDHGESIAAMLDRGEDLTALDGIGKGVAEKCQELVTTGSLEQMETLLETVPRSVLDLLNVPNLGPKKAAALFNELQIATLDQLQAACEAGEVQKLPGFGAKTEQQILDGIGIAQAAQQRILWVEADKLAQRIAQHLADETAIRRWEFAGSYRRGRETVGDLDLLVDSADPEAVMDRFGEFPEITSVIARGDTKMSVRLEGEFQVDLRVVPEEAFGAALQYFTGSKDHNVLIRGRAKRQGLKVNEWGVFQVSGDQETWIAGKTETDVYETLELPWIAPELREARRELDWAESGQLPELITVNDLVGDLHMHTTATDGKNSIEEMAAAAQSLGHRYIAITDHSQRVSMANGLDAERARAQWKQIDAINDAATFELKILKGIECDILEAGGMDLDDATLALADFVIASIHYGQNQSREQITDRIVGAIKNPHVAMVAHPTGRLINRREPYDVDLDAVFQAAREHHTLLELNANPRRLDLNDVQLMAAKSDGIPIVINTDAHSTTGLENLRFGITQARRGGLTAGDVANTRDWDAIRTLLGRN